MRRALAWLGLLAAACSTPRERSDLTFAFTPAVARDPVAALALEQRVLVRGSLEVDTVLSLGRLGLERGADGREDGYEVRAGVRAELGSLALPGRPWVGVGAVWLRARGVPRILDGPGDYGGLWLALGDRFPLGGGWRAGPRAELLLVDGEGSLGSALLPRVGLDLVWSP